MQSVPFEDGGPFSGNSGGTSKIIRGLGGNQVNECYLHNSSAVEMGYTWRH